MTNATPYGPRLDVSTPVLNVALTYNAKRMDLADIELPHPYAATYQKTQCKPPILKTFNINIFVLLFDT